MTMSFTLRRTLGALLVLTLVLALGVPLAGAQDDSSRTIRDFMGREVTLDAPPQRVVGMSASINEMLFAIGVTPAGVTAGMEHPAAAASLPTFGTGYQPDLEALAALEPDLIVANMQLNTQLLPQLEAIAPTIMVLPLTAQDVVGIVQLLGQATWHDTEAAFLSQAYADFLTMASAAGSGMDDAPTVLIVVGTLEVPNYGKSATYLGDMLARLGAVNVADAEPDAGPFPGYAQLSIEAILEADPDYIFTVTRGAPTPMAETMADDDIWSSLTAVAEGHVYELDNRLYLEAPGPRFTEAMINLYAILYGDM